MLDFEHSLPQKVEIREVGPREGFQAIKQVIPTEEKIRLINALMDTGVRRLQVTSFAHPKVVPQHADAEDVLNGITRREGVEVAVLIPNPKAAERAIKCKTDEWNCMLSVSDSHSMANSNKTTMQALEGVKDIVAMSKDAGVVLTGSMGTALGCPFEGEIPLSRLCTVVEEYLKMGVTNIGISDTAGMANPLLTYHTVKELVTRYPQVSYKLHFHNTRGMGLANVVAAMLAGATIFDSSVAGLGGCPFVPKASGNIPTEDMVHMMNLMGIETGIDVHRVIEISKGMEASYGFVSKGYVTQAGTSDQLHDFVAARIASSKK